PADPHEIYLGFDPAEDEPRAAKHRLVKELKRAVDDATLLDPTPTTRDELDALADNVAALADRMEQSPSLRPFGGAAVAGPPHAAVPAHRLRGLARPRRRSQDLVQGHRPPRRRAPRRGRDRVHLPRVRRHPRHRVLLAS